MCTLRVLSVCKNLGILLPCTVVLVVVVKCRCVLCQSECNSNVTCSSRNSLPHRGAVTEPAAVVVVESAFSRLLVQTSHTTHVQNYDRSEVTTTSTRHKDGIETVSEVTAWPDGQVIVHELVRNMASGKTSKHNAIAALSSNYFSVCTCGKRQSFNNAVIL